jgi:oxalate decarboxylase
MVVAATASAVADHKFLDVSLTQWMALTPHELVQAHLNVSRALIDALPTVKHPIV